MREAVGVRLAAIAVAVFLAWYLKPALMLIAMIVLGQVHFFLAYWYQADAGKWNLKKIAFFAGFFAASLWLLGQISFPLFIVITGVTFAIHFAMDEIYLMKGTVSLFTTLEGAPFVLLYGAFLSDSLLHTSIFWPAVFVSVALFGWYVLLSFLKKRTPDHISFMYAGWVVATIIAQPLFTMYHIDSSLWFLGLIAIHYGVWYGAYWFILRAKPERRVVYLARVFGLNALFVGMGYLWFMRLLPPLDILFLPSLFYVWTLLHIATSVRVSDVKLLLRLP